MRWMTMGLLALGVVACDEAQGERGQATPGTWKKTELTAHDSPRTFDIGPVPFKVVACYARDYAEHCTDISDNFDVYDDRLCRAGDPDDCEIYVANPGDRLLVWRVAQ